MAMKVFQKRVDEDLFNEVSEIYQSLGTSVGEAFVMFLMKSKEENGLPFELRKRQLHEELNEQIKKLAFENSPIKKIDWEDEKAVKELLDDW